MSKLFVLALNALLVTLIFATAFSCAQDQETGDSAEEASISFTFQYAPWTEVLKWYADKAGLSLDSQDVPPGTFNYYHAQKYTVSQTLDVLNGYLIPKGYLLVRRDNFLVSLNIENGVPPSVIPNVTLDELSQRGRSELMRVVLPVRGMSVNEAAEEMEKLLGPLGNVVLLPSVNSLAVTGLGDDLRQIQKLYGAAPRDNESEMVFRVFQLKQIPATEADRTIRRFFELPASDVRTSSAVAAPTDSRRHAPIKMTYESRTNSLLVTASASDLVRIEQLIEVIDVEANQTAQSLSQTRLHVIRVRGVKAADIGQAFEALSPAQISVERAGLQPAVPAATRTETESQPQPGGR